MKKSKSQIIIFALTLALIFLTGCSSAKTTKIESNPIKNDINIEEREIIKIAYNWLSEKDRENISELENAKVENIKPYKDFFILNSGKTINLKEKEVYMITFGEINKTKTGATTVFVDKNSHIILGTGIGE